MAILKFMDTPPDPIPCEELHHYSDTSAIRQKGLRERSLEKLHKTNYFCLFLLVFVPCFQYILFIPGLPCAVLLVYF